MQNVTRTSEAVDRHFALCSLTQSITSEIVSRINDRRVVTQELEEEKTEEDEDEEELFHFRISVRAMD